MPGDDPEASWLSLAEVGRRTGRHPDTLRAMIRRGRLSGRKSNSGAWLVQMPVSGSDPERRPDVSGGSPEGYRNGSGSDPDIDPDERDFLRQELLDARERVARAEGELAAEARRSIDLLAVIGDLRTDRDRLAAELAEARKGWLERLQEALRKV